MSRRQYAVLLAVAFFASTAVYIVGEVVSDRPVTGDEPSYLLLAHSILLDGDLDLSADVRSRERMALSENPVGAEPHEFDYRGDGRLRSQHPIGTAVLLLPAVALARAAGWSAAGAARVEMAIVRGLASALLLALALRLTGRRAGAGAVAWAGAALAVPVLPFASQLYPEVPALAVFTAGLLAIGSKTAGPRSAAVAGLATAVLPWLQVRFAPLSIALVLAWAVQHRKMLRDWWVSVALLVPPAMSFVVMAGVYIHLYGSPSPATPFQGGPAGAPTTTSANLWREGVGNFLSASHGWVPYAPVAALALPAAAAATLRLRGSVAAAVLAIGVVGYSVLVGWSFQGGSLPVRFLVVAAPATVVGVAALVRAGGRFALAGSALVALSMLIGLVSPWAGNRLYDQRGRSAAPVARYLAPLFPTFVTPGVEQLRRLTLRPGEAAAQTGRVEVAAGRAIRVAEAGRDAGGYLVYGPYAELPPARWRASFPLDGGGDVCTDIVAGGTNVLAERCLAAAADVVLPFTTSWGDIVEARVLWTGTGRAGVGTVTVEPVADLRPARGWPWVAAWAVGLAAMTGWMARRLTPYGRAR